MRLIIALITFIPSAVFATCDNTITRCRNGICKEYQTCEYTVVKKNPCYAKDAEISVLKLQKMELENASPQVVEKVVYRTIRKKNKVAVLGGYGPTGVTGKVMNVTPNNFQARTSLERSLVLGLGYSRRLNNSDYLLTIQGFSNIMVVGGVEKEF